MQERDNVDGEVVVDCGVVVSVVTMPDSLPWVLCAVSMHKGRSLSSKEFPAIEPPRSDCSELASGC